MAKKSFNASPLFIVLYAVVIPCLFYYGLYSLTKFRVRKDLSPETKHQMATLAKCSGMEDYIERYGERGPMDIDYQIETCSFESLTDLSNAIAGESKTTAVDAEIDKILFGSSSSGNQSAPVPLESWIIRGFSKATPRNGRDLKGKKVKIYEVDSYSPQNDKTYQTDGSYQQEYYWDWTYSVYEYRDGTYRFVVNVMTS